MTKPRHKYTIEQDQTIRELWTSNLKAAEIGVKIGLSGPAVIHRGRALGLPNRGVKRTIPVRKVIEKAPSKTINGRPKEIYKGYGTPIKLLVELEPGECRFPIEPHNPEGKEHTQWFCAAPADDSGYCKDHHRICFRGKE